MGVTAVQVKPEPTTSQPAQLETVYLKLPNMGLGFVASLLGVAIEGGMFIEKIPPGPAIISRLLISFFAWAYWIFCVFRIHKILARATHHTYKVSPIRAIWPQFIPLYCWIWSVQWTHRLATFLNSRDSSLKMKAWWPGLLLLLGSLLGFVFYISCLHLFVMFGVGLYLSRKIRRVVPLSETTSRLRSEQISLAWTAGLGAGFGLMLYQAGREFFLNKSAGDQFREIAVIILVSLGIIKFVEPLAEWMRGSLHHHAHSNETQHSREQEKRTLMVRGAIFLVLAFSGFSHELLTGYIKDDPWGAMRMLAAMLTISGGITYAWAVGARRKKLRAGALGIVSGGSLALVLIMTLFLAFDNSAAYAKNIPSSQIASRYEAAVVPGTNTISKSINTILSQSPVVIPVLIGSNVNPVSTVAVNLMLWGILGLIGGLVIDRQWGGGATRNIVLSLLTATLLLELVLEFMAMANSNEIALGVAAVLGWCLSLLIYPGVDKVLKTT